MVTTRGGGGGRKDNYVKNAEMNVVQPNSSLLSKLNKKMTEETKKRSDK